MRSQPVLEHDGRDPHPVEPFGDRAAFMVSVAAVTPTWTDDDDRSRRLFGGRAIEGQRWLETWGILRHARRTIGPERHRLGNGWPVIGRRRSLDGTDKQNQGSQSHFDDINDHGSGPFDRRRNGFIPIESDLGSDPTRCQEPHSLGPTSVGFASIPTSDITRARSAKTADDTS